MAALLAAFVGTAQFALCALWFNSGHKFIKCVDPVVLSYNWNMLWMCGGLYHYWQEWQIQGSLYNRYSLVLYLLSLICKVHNRYYPVQYGWDFPFSRCYWLITHAHTETVIHSLCSAIEYVHKWKILVHPMMFLGILCVAVACCHLSLTPLSEWVDS